MCLFRFIVYLFFCVSSDHFIPVLLAFVVLSLVQYQAKSLAGKTSPKYFCNRGREISGSMGVG